MEWIGIRKGGSRKAAVKKCPVDTFLARGPQKRYYFKQ